MGNFFSKKSNSFAKKSNNMVIENVIIPTKALFKNTPEQATNYLSKNKFGKNGSIKNGKFNINFKYVAISNGLYLVVLTQAAEIEQICQSYNKCVLLPKYSKELELYEDRIKTLESLTVGCVNDHNEIPDMDSCQSILPTCDESTTICIYAIFERDLQNLISILSRCGK